MQPATMIEQNYNDNNNRNNNDNDNDALYKLHTQMGI